MLEPWSCGASRCGASKSRAQRADAGNGPWPCSLTTTKPQLNACAPCSPIRESRSPTSRSRPRPCGDSRMRQVQQGSNEIYCGCGELQPATGAEPFGDTRQYAAKSTESAANWFASSRTRVHYMTFRYGGRGKLTAER